MLLAVLLLLAIGKIVKTRHLTKITYFAIIIAISFMFIRFSFYYFVSRNNDTIIHLLKKVQSVYIYGWTVIYAPISSAIMMNQYFSLFNSIFRVILEVFIQIPSIIIILIGIFHIKRDRRNKYTNYSNKK